MKIKTISLVCTFAFIFSGCAVSPFEMARMEEKTSTQVNKSIANQKNQLKQESSLTRISANYLGDNPVDLPYAAKLPPIFFENVVIRQKGLNYGTVAQAAKNISLATGLSVRVNPDVAATPATPGVAGTGGAANAQLNNLPVGGKGIPLGTALPGAAGPTAIPATNTVALESRNTVRLDYQGQLLSYINQVAVSGGVNWEYRDNGIYFYRLKTEIFTLANLNPGDISVSDSMSKGGQAATGSTGAANATGTGSFTSASSVGTTGSYSVWKLLKPALESALSPQGKMSINEGTGTITVTDTKESLHRIKTIISHEDSLLGRQIAVDVRVIKVALNNTTQAGIDLNAVYKSLAGNTLSVVAPASNAASIAGAMTFKIKDPNSKFEGSSAGIQALNEFGNIASDASSTLITSNRMPAMTGAFTTTGFLAQTTPAAGGGTSGGQGVPGLTPGSVTTGSFLRVTPTIKENNTIFMSLSVDLSDLLGIGSASTGSGQTLQQIQWANTSGTKSTSNILLLQNEAMVMVGIGNDSVRSNSGNSFSGGSINANKKKDLFVIVITPRIMRGI